MPAWFQRVFMVNGSLKFIAFVLTLALFTFVREDRESAVTGQVPIRLVIPEAMVLVSQPPDRVRVTVGGRWSDLNKFDPSQLNPITVEVKEDTTGLVGITPEMIPGLPTGLRVTAIQPNYVRVELEPAAKKMVDIRPKRVGEPGSSFDLGEIEVRPKEIEVRGPRSAVDALEYLWTEPVDVTDRTESFEKRVQLRVDNPFLQYDVERTISVRVPINTQEVQRTIQDVPALGVNTTYAVEIKPPALSVSVRGPKPIVDKLTADVLRGEIDLTAESSRPPGTFSKQPRIVNLPDGVNLVQFHPRDFVVVTSRRAREAPDEPTEPTPASDAGTAPQNANPPAE